MIEFDNSFFKFIWCILLFQIIIACNERPVYGQPKHDEAAIILLNRLKLNQTEGRILFGHHDDLLYGYNWKNDQDSKEFDKSDIKEVSGDYPAILGFDLGSIEYYGLTFERGNTFTAMIDAIKRHHERGGIVTISAHMRNVITGGSAWDTSYRGVVKSVLKDEKTRKRFYKVLDLYCEFFSLLVDSTGKRIPLLFRPWHESNLSCFWWGGSNSSDIDYRRLWQITYDYIVKEKGFKNLVWVYSPSEVTSERFFNKRYPGDSYVDVIGFECYQRLFEGETIEQSNRRFASTMKQGLSLLNILKIKHNKLGAITETGFAAVPKKDWWTENLYPQLVDSIVSYVFVWGNRFQDKEKVYGPYRGSIDADNFKEFSSLKECTLLKKMK